MLAKNITNVKHLLLLIKFTLWTCDLKLFIIFEKYYREPIRSRNEDSRFIVTKITMELRALIWSSVQLGRVIFCIITILLVIIKEKTEQSCCWRWSASVFKQTRPSYNMLNYPNWWSIKCVHNVKPTYAICFMTPSCLFCRKLFKSIQGG